MPEDMFDGASLEAALADKRFAKAGAELVGMAKPSDRKGYIAFSKAGCETWVDVPSSMIERAVHRGEVRCKDHSHPLFAITLKEPSDPEGKVLIALLAQAAQGGVAAPGNGLPAPGMPGAGAAPMQRLGIGGFGGYGGIEGVFGWGSTLPSCHYEVQYLPCGSALPGYPVPTCPTYVYCCTWPNGAKSCI